MNRKIRTTVAVIAALTALSTVAVPAGSSARNEVAAGPGSWTFEGKADLHDSGALDMKVRSIAGAPRSYDLVRRLLVGRDVLLVNIPARIVDSSGRPVALSLLNDAIVRVKGTLQPAGQWLYDLDGETTPTVRVSRMVVLQLDLD